MTHPGDGAGGVPELGVSRLLLVGTGSVSVSDLPFWAEWLRAGYPGLEVRTVLTRSAERFVSPAAVAARTGGEVLTDAWPDDTSPARHVAWAEWAEAVVIHPATLHFVARLALGLADTPAVLAAQCTTAPVAVAPALPPGGLESAAYRAHWAALTARDNVVVAPPRPGTSATTGRAGAWVPALLPDVIELLEARRRALADAAGARTPLPPPAALLADGGAP
ncbi:flavoprotein [Streptomyces sp. NPDC015131]|uniref:flavoprotein n=1 Tax=Streptomyces sp. NPDC015131 TaxID=3364941 RepID=UPI003702612D